MKKKIFFAAAILMLMASVTSIAQSLDGNPYTPGKDPDIDLFINSWENSMPRHTHGSLIERDILTRGNSLKPPKKGAVLEYINYFSFATLAEGNSTTPTELSDSQEIIYINSGKGVINSGKKTYKLYPGICALIPAKLSFTMTADTGEPLTMYLISEPVPNGFRPNNEILIRDENTLPVVSTNGHWIHIVKQLFKTQDGLGTLESIITVSFDPMTIGHPHSHIKGCEEVWTELTGTSLAFIGKQIRWQQPGMAYMIPPDGNTPHSNINSSDKQIKMLYFARYGEHELRK